MKLQNSINKLNLKTLTKPNKISLWKNIFLSLDLCFQKDKHVMCAVSNSLSCEACKSLDSSNLESKTHKLSKCSHFVCKECVKQSVKEATDGLYNDQFIFSLCPICKVQINIEDILTIVPHKEMCNLNKTATKAVTGNISCPICTIAQVPDKIIYLECEHYLCDDCAKLQLGNEIKKGTSPGCSICQKPVSFQIIINLFNDPSLLLTTFNNYILEKKGDTINKLGKANEDTEILSNCSNCLIQFSILPKPSIIECPKGCIIKDKQKKAIHFILCILCSKKGHIGKTCQEYSKEDPFTLKLLTDNPELRMCPYCGVIVGRSKGCNMMVCESYICNKKTSFCFVCNQKVEPFDDYEHFGSDKYRNCFGQYCINFKDPSGQVKYKAK